MQISLEPCSILNSNQRHTFYILPEHSYCRTYLYEHNTESTDEYNEDVFLTEVSNKIDNVLEATKASYKIANSINEFRHALKNSFFKLKIAYSAYYVIMDNCLLLFTKKRENNIHVNLNIRYNFENEHMRNIFIELLNPNDYVYNKTTTISGYGVNKIFVDPLLMEILVLCKLIHANGESIYNQFQKRFPNGKVRILDEPHPILRRPLKEFNSKLYQTYGYLNHECQFAYKKGKNIVDNALPHKDHRYVFKADIEDFFPSCKKPLVAKYLMRYFKHSLNPAEYLDCFLNMMLVNSALCLGNPISPVLANTIISKPAKYIYNMCSKTGISFTQYCDDLTFSSDRPIAKDYIIKIFNEAYDTYHLGTYFHLKHRKLIGQCGQQRNVTGIAFDHTNNNTPTPKRSLYRKLRASIHKLSLGENVNVNKIKGQIAYMVMIGKGARILKYLEKFPELENRLISPRLKDKIMLGLQSLNVNNLFEQPEDLPF